MKTDNKVVEKLSEQYSEISETDSSNLSISNPNEKNLINVKYLKKPENAQEKKKKKSNVSYDEFSKINSDSFFDTNIETRIKYPNQEMKKNKFNNLLCKENENH